MTEFSAHRAKVAAIAGESSAVPFEDAYLDGMTQIKGRDSEARESAQRADKVGDSTVEGTSGIAKESTARRDDIVEAIM